MARETHLPLPGLAALVLLALPWAASGSTPLPTLTSPLGPVVNLGFAAFAGNDTSPSGQPRSSVTFFGNIPYAQPPVGNLRFRAPRPLDETIRDPSRVPISDARDWGAPCIQQPAQVGIGSEDCLKLNIWKPSSASESSKLPVIVYFHGGGFFAGSPLGFPFFDWLSQNQGIVAVSVAYRLNLLGFLGGAAVAADGDLNAGLRDQRAALEWVQRNIHRFGGNPDEVTIAGESAGAASVVMQTVAFGGSKPPVFKRAIVQSIGFGPTPTSEEVEDTFKNVSTVVGCTGRDVMQCLRSASIGAIVSAINRASVPPVVEGPGGFLPDLPSHLIASGRFTNVGLIGGHCTNDGRTFVGGTPAQFNSEEDIRRLLFARYSGVTAATMQRAFELYPAPDAMAQDIVLGCMDLKLAQALTSRGVDNVFMFRWNSPHAVLFEETPFEGVMHTSDLYFLFDGTVRLPNALNSFRAFNESEARLSQEAIGFWTSFVSSGSPSMENTPERVTWAPFMSDTASSATNTIHNRLVLQRGSDEGAQTSSRIESIPSVEFERCNFWMSANVTAETRV
ncbi:Carboxylic ester hydrolase [Pleurotus pulmonarius]